MHGLHVLSSVISHEELMSHKAVTCSRIAGGRDSESAESGLLVLTSPGSMTLVPRNPRAKIQAQRMQQYEYPRVCQYRTSACPGSVLWEYHSIQLGGAIQPRMSTLLSKLCILSNR